jgi:hypothetical protein
MRPAFWMNVLAFSCFGALLCWARYRLELMQRQVHDAQALEALMDDTTESVKSVRGRAAS